MKTARLIKKIDGWAGDARLYELSEPLERHSLIVVSAAYAMFSGPETYIFAASNIDGEVKDFRELEGSQRGMISHEKALATAGYTVRK